MLRGRDKDHNEAETKISSEVFVFLPTSSKQTKPSI